MNPNTSLQGCPSHSGRGGLKKSLQVCAGPIGRWGREALALALALLIRVLQDPPTTMPMWSIRSGTLSEELTNSSVDRLSKSK